MKAWDIVGYAHEADLHCVDCTRARFTDPDAAVDNEGNLVHPVFASDAVDDDVCGDCHERLIG